MNISKALPTVFIILAALVACSDDSAVDLTEGQRAAIEERIRPAVEICLEGDSSCGGGATAAAAGGVAVGVARSGEDVYGTACLACHLTGAAGAPILGDVAAWAPRIAKGMDALYVSGIAGIAGTGMIAKGGCGSCSDEEVRAAVDHMVAASK